MRGTANKRFSEKRKIPHIGTDLFKIAISFDLVTRDTIDLGVKPFELTVIGGGEDLCGLPPRFDVAVMKAIGAPQNPVDRDPGRLVNVDKR
jgi:hypothetical protein